MVIISVAIVNRSGKALVARQYRDISRVRIEGLLTAFPKLIQPNSEHTFVETDSVRYVYTPMELLYLVLVTTKSSNIVEDLDTLQMISRVVKETCSSFISEDEVIQQAYELMMAFDELISMGFREKLEMDQIHNILEMESHEEVLQNMIRQSKIEDAILRGRNKAAEIAVDKAKHTGRYGQGIGSSDAGFGRGSGGGGGFESSSSSSYGRSPSATPSGEMGKYTGISSQSASAASSGGYGKPSYGSSGGASTTTTAATKSGIKPPTMKLIPTGVKSQPKTNELFREMAKNEDISLDDQLDEEEDQGRNVSGATGVSLPVPHAHPTVQKKSIHIQVEEQFRAEVNHEGGAKVSLKGEMLFNIEDESQGTIRVQILQPATSDKSYTVKTHPKIDKQLYTDNRIIGLKNAKRPFPAGNLKVLTWRMQEEDESFLPFTVSCWPSPSAEGLSVSVEYELVRKDIELNNVVIAIPIPDTENVQVESIEHGHYKIDARNGLFLWYLDNVDVSIKNTSGSLEFLVAGARGDESSCFPVNVQFSSQKTLMGVSVEDVVSSIDGKPVTHSKESLLQVAEYTIV